MMREDATRTPSATGTGASVAAASGSPAAGRPRPRRTLSTADRLVRVPLGLLWLGVLAIIALPVMFFMTALAFGMRWTSALFGRNARRRVDRADREERLA